MSEYSGPNRRTNVETPLGDTARILAILYTVGYFIVIFTVIWAKVPIENKDIILQLVGILSIIESTVVAFFFGGSKAAELSVKANVEGKAKADDALQTIAKAIPDVLPNIEKKNGN